MQQFELGAGFLEYAPETFCTIFRCVVVEMRRAERVRKGEDDADALQQPKLAFLYAARHFGCAPETCYT